MTLKTIQLKLPEGLLSYFGNSKAEIQRHVTQVLALTLVGQGTVTASYAAGVLGCSYHEMLDLMTKHNVPLIRYSPDEVDAGLKTLKSYPR